MARKIVVTAPKHVEVQQVEDPPLKPGTVRVEAHHLGISAGTELNTYRGGVNWHTGRDSYRLFEADADQNTWQYPAKVGYAHVGRVVEVGPAVERLKAGQLVFSTAPHITPAVIPADRVFAIPDGQEPRRYVFYALVRTALNITHHARPTFGDTVAVFGAGVVGLLTTAMLRRAGAGRVIVLDPIPQRREMAGRFGADVTLDPTERDPAYVIRDHNAGRGADVAIEASANAKAVQQCPRAVEPKGRVIIGSMPGEPIPFHFGQEVHFNGIAITGANVMQMPGYMAQQWDMDRRDAWARALLDQLDLLPLLTHEYELDDAAQAYEKIDTAPQDVVSLTLRCPSANGGE